MDKKLEVLLLPDKVVKILSEHKIETVQQLSDYDKSDDLTGIEGINATTAKEIRKSLMEYEKELQRKEEQEKAKAISIQEKVDEFKAWESKVVPEVSEEEVNEVLQGIAKVIDSIRKNKSKFAAKEGNDLSMVALALSNLNCTLGTYEAKLGAMVRENELMIENLEDQFFFQYKVKLVNGKVPGDEYCKRKARMDIFALQLLALGVEEKYKECKNQIKTVDKEISAIQSRMNDLRSEMVASNDKRIQ